MTTATVRDVRLAMLIFVVMAVAIVAAPVLAIDPALAWLIASLVVISRRRR